MCGDLAELKEKQIHAERKISSIPEEETLVNIQRQISECKDNLIQEKAKCEIIKEQLIITQRQIEHAESKLVGTKLTINRDSIELELKNRTFNNVQDVKSILDRFQLLMLEKHIKHLEVLILDSFLTLIRKANLVAKIAIDPVTYQIQLLDSTLEHIPSGRLSAGERQILAISILWGLAKASGRPLPMIIDTPLGRLDSMHRKHLVDNYFPTASHQVILLSTDQEIDQGYRDDLSKYIGREYHIQYEEKLQTSTIREGYF
jgi:DNA sulfur modification protein DndD